MRARSLIFLCLFFLPSQAASPSAKDGEGARAFLQRLSDNALTQLTDGNAEKAEVQRRFRALYEANFDTEAMPYLVLGTYWRKATPEQRREFTAAFEDFLTAKYSERFSDLKLETFRIKSVNQVRSDAFVVSSVVEDENNESVVVDWRIRFKKDYRIYDLSIAGISMVATQREDFASVIRREGGIDGLIAILKKEGAKRP